MLPEKSRAGWVLKSVYVFKSEGSLGSKPTYHADSSHE